MNTSTTRSNSIVYVNDTTALVTKAFAKKANIFGTPEFALWREYKAMYPHAEMHTKSIKRNPAKTVDTRNMTYRNMAEFIRAQADAEKLMDEFELAVKRSKVQTNPYRYVLAWFEQRLEKYDADYKAYFAERAEKANEKNNIFYLETVASEYTIADKKTAVNG